MPYRPIPLTSLLVNPANDRHGELENETAAIAQLFATQEQHMRNLAKDIVTTRTVFEPPLVFPRGDKFVVADGNRRTTCLKLLAKPSRAPTTELQAYFKDLRAKWVGEFPDKIECRVETDRDTVDDILYRRHTGVQGGIGQSNWNDRMKNNFVLRTGKSTGLNIADEIEARLRQAKLEPRGQIPRSNLRRLLSSEALRHRLGVSVKKGKFSFIRDEQTSLRALSRVASDLASRKITLDDIWDTESKLKYIDALEKEGILPSAADMPEPAPKKPDDPKPAPRPTPTAPRQPQWPHLIPNVDYEVVWTAHLQRHRAIWEELQFQLDLSKHPNAISVLLRVLFEISIENYLSRTKVKIVHDNDKLSNKATKIAEHLLANGKIDKKQADVIKKMHHSESIVSTDTLNRYVHSPHFSVSPEHLKVLWLNLAGFIVLCLRS